MYIIAYSFVEMFNVWQRAELFLRTHNVPLGSFTLAMAKPI